MVVWVGGLIFFAFVVAPVAFGRLGSPHEAGLMVGASLRVLHWMGLGSGVLFLLATALGARGIFGARTASLLVLAMLGLTAWSQFAVLPRMERDRVAAGGIIAAAERGSGPAAEFDRLHHLSERMEGAVLLGGLAVVVLLGMESDAVRRL